jgi:hypothetical protein
MPTETPPPVQEVHDDTLIRDETVFSKEWNGNGPTLYSWKEPTVQWMSYDKQSTYCAVIKGDTMLTYSNLFQKPGLLISDNSGGGRHLDLRPEGIPLELPRVWVVKGRGTLAPSTKPSSFQPIKTRTTTQFIRVREDGSCRLSSTDGW